MTKKNKNLINSILFLCLGMGLFYWAVNKVGFSNIIDDIRQAKTGYILLAMSCGVLSHLARALRWNLLLEPLGYKARVAGTFHAVILGYLVNMAVPRLGEITRPAALSKLEDIPFNKLVGTVLIERVIDLIITLLISVSIVFIQFHIISDFLIDLFGGGNEGQIAIYSGIGLIGLIILILLYRYRFKIYQLAIFNKVKSFIEGMIEGLKSVFHLRRKMLFIFYSLLIWFMYFCMPYFVLFALSGTAHLGVGAGLTVLLFGTIAMIIPVPGGVGTFHVLVPVALSFYGISEATGNSYAVLTHAIQVMVVLGVGIISVVYFAYHAQLRKKNELEKSNRE